MVDVIAPNNSATYRAVRDAAGREGVDPAFRDLCMLFKAPPYLNVFFLVVRNVEYMLRVLPAEWSARDIFPGWREMAAWAIKNQDHLIKLAGETLKEHPRIKNVLGADVTVHPMQGSGLSQFPIYSAMCNTHELPEQRENYALLQAQLLVARREELRENAAHNSRAYIDLYESHAEPGDFARHVRQADAAARAVREISLGIYGPMLAFMQPERTAESFAVSLPKPGDELPEILFLRKRLEHIRHYCGLMTSPRPNGTRVYGESYGGGAGVHGYIEYSNIRFGIEYTNGDPDDPCLDLSQQELIREHSVDREVALAHDIDPGETALGAGFILQGDSQQTGSTPCKFALARTRMPLIEIDKDRMRWSARHLQPKEIAGTLLQKLVATAKAACFGQVDAVELENCALIAVCMETSRPLKLAVTLRADRILEGDFLFVPSNREDVSQWCWKAIEPLYKQERPPVAGKEVIRNPHLCYPVHATANLLLRQLQRRLPGSQPELFREPLEVYEKRLKTWLRKLDPTGRLTIGKISNLKWLLLSQASAGDIAEASLVLGQPHPMARVPLFYSLLSVDDAGELFQKATLALWGEVWSAKTSGASKTSDLVLYTGSRSCPDQKTARAAIRITKKSAMQFARMDLRADLPGDFVVIFNRAVLYLLWHQFYAIGTRGIRLPYIPLAEVCSSSGVATLADKDSGNGYKTRLVWMPPGLLEHMRQAEPLVDQVRGRLQLDWNRELSPLFFLDDDMRAIEIRPKSIEDLSREFFPFPSNTPRRVMRFLLRNAGLSSEMVEVFMGHWLERREPWAKWSSLDYSEYLENLRIHIPNVLDELGFKCPLNGRKSRSANAN
jgi:hypothetical protein